MNSRWIRRLALIVVTVLILGGLYRFQFDNRPSKFFASHTVAAKQYQNFIDTFGSDNRLLIAVEDTAPTLKTNTDPAIKALSSIAPVTSVISREILVTDEATQAIQVFQAEIEDQPRGPGLIPEIRAQLGRILPQAKIHVVGPAAVQDHLGSMMQHDLMRFVPLLLAITFFGGWFLNRSWQAGAIILAHLAFSSLFSLGIFSVFGFHASLLTALFFPLIFIVSMNNAIHLIEARKHAVNWLHAAYKITRPCLLANLTTGAAFASLIPNDIMAIQELGLLSVLGVATSCWLTLLPLPALLDKWSYQPNRQSMSYQSKIPSLAGKYFLLTAFGALTLSLVLFPGSLRLEPNIMTALDAQDSLKQDVAFFEKHLHPTAGFEIVIKRVEQNSAKLQSAINQLQTQLTSEMPQAVLVPGTLKITDSSQRKGKMRLTVYVPDAGFSEMKEMQARLDHVLKRINLPGDWYITGLVPRWLETQHALLVGILHGFATAFLVVFLSIGIGFRSWRYMLASIWPNLLPILTILGLVHVLQIPLDLVTVLLGVVCLGFAVDDTVYILAMQADPYGAHRNHVRRALFQTSLIATVGFVLFGLSAFPPMRTFGVLGATAVVVALLADLYLLPALTDLFVSFRPAPFFQSIAKKVTRWLTHSHVH